MHNPHVVSRNFAQFYIQFHQRSKKLSILLMLCVTNPTHGINTYLLSRSSPSPIMSITFKSLQNMEYFCPRTSTAKLLTFMMTVIKPLKLKPKLIKLFHFIFVVLRNFIRTKQGITYIQNTCNFQTNSCRALEEEPGPNIWASVS